MVQKRTPIRLKADTLDEAAARFASPRLRQEAVRRQWEKWQSARGS